MFLVFNKEKIYAYLVSVVTIVLLLGLATTMNSKDTIETSSNNTRLLPIYNVQTEENKVAFTMNCAW